MKNAIDDISFATSGTQGGTNWEAAFLEASNSRSVTSDPNKPADLVVIITDGNPTVYGYPDPDTSDTTGVFDQIDLDRAINASNVVKNEGTRVVAVGIGQGNTFEDNLKAITDGDSATINDDYYLDDFEGLQSDLRAIASDLNCNIAISKTANETVVTSGASVAFTVEVTNPGRVPLQNVNVVDDQYTLSGNPTGDDGDGILAPNGAETWVYEYTAVISSTTTNTATVTATDSDGNQVTDTDSVTVSVVTPELTVDKTHDVDGDGFTDNGETAQPGEAVTYRVVITNTGTVALNLTNFTDNQYDLTTVGFTCALPTTNAPLTLAPGANITCDFVGEAPLDYSAEKTNQFDATASYLGDNTLTDGDTTTVQTTEQTTNVCTRTIGYWSTHAGFTGNNPDVVTQYLPVWLGTPNGAESVLVTDNQTAVELLTRSYESGSSSNGISKLYAQLLAAKLNIENGAAANQSVLATIDAADTFLAANGQDSWQSLSRDEKQEVLGWATALDGYNNYQQEGCTTSDAPRKPLDREEEAEESGDESDTPAAPPADPGDPGAPIVNDRESPDRSDDSNRQVPPGKPDVVAQYDADSSSTIDERELLSALARYNNGVSDRDLLRLLAVYVK